MSHDNDGETPLRSYAGSVDRDAPLLELGPITPWASRVTVTALDLPGIGKTFEVRVTRFGGPKLEGTPDPVDRRSGAFVRVAQVDDVIAEPVGERAREVAMRAADELRKSRVPDLKALAAAIPKSAK